MGVRSLQACMVLATVFAFAGTVTAQQDCSGCSLSPVILQGQCEWTLNPGSVFCQGVIENINITDGVPGAPLPVTSAICDACNSSQAGEVGLSYTQTVGYQFCFTVGGQVQQWIVPDFFGLTWTNQTTLCFNSTVTNGVSTSFTCDPGTKRRADVFVQIVPMTISITGSTYLKGTYLRTQGGLACAAQKDHGIPCNGFNIATTSTRNLYTVVFTDLTCPPSAPGTGPGNP